MEEFDIYGNPITTMTPSGWRASDLTASQFSTGSNPLLTGIFSSAFNGLKGGLDWLINPGISTTIQGRNGTLATLPGQTGLEKLGGYGKGLLEAGQLWSGIGAARKQGKYIDTMIASQKLNQDLMRKQIADSEAYNRRREARNRGLSGVAVEDYGKTGNPDYLTMRNYG